MQHALTRSLHRLWIPRLEWRDNDPASGCQGGNGEYVFGFDRVKQWVDLCQSCGIEYFEMCHLSLQWGAKYAPKVVAMVDGEEKQIFGWHTPAVGEYTKFLHALLPQLTQKLKEWALTR